MSRNVPYDLNAICDVCGATGAYDFMGDLLCHKCAEEALPSEQPLAPPSAPASSPKNLYQSLRDSGQDVRHMTRETLEREVLNMRAAIDAACAQARLEELRLIPRANPAWSDGTGLEGYLSRRIRELERLSKGASK